MNLNNYESRNAILIDWVLEDLPQRARILDVGANDGSFCPEIRRLAEAAEVFAGVDPDVEKLARNPLLHRSYAGRLEEASLPAGEFDCLVSIYVAEHVQTPFEFLRAAARALKPGGTLYFITPNGEHYFALIAGIFARMGIQERVLRWLRPDALVDAYHYPALYQLNRPAAIERMAREAGFLNAEFRYSERYEELACYFPGPLKLFPRVWERAAQILNAERLLGNLMVKLAKPV